MMKPIKYSETNNTIKQHAIEPEEMRVNPNHEAPYLIPKEKIQELQELLKPSQ